MYWHCLSYHLTFYKAHPLTGQHLTLGSIFNSRNLYTLLCADHLQAIQLPITAANQNDNEYPSRLGLDPELLKRPLKMPSNVLEELSPERPSSKGIFTAGL